MSKKTLKRYSGAETSLGALAATPKAAALKIQGRSTQRRRGTAEASRGKRA